jgi:hypothetical protein
MVPGQYLYIQGGGFYTVSSIADSTNVVLTSLGYPGDVIPETTVIAGSGVSSGGVQGPAGLLGPTGPQGIMGVIGLTGLPGATGATGSTGPAGPAGPAGITGPVGQLGPSGATGATGPAGPAGVAGPTGAVGPAGATGAEGVSGPTGQAGPAGPAGATGPAGPSSNAYAAFATEATGTTLADIPTGIVATLQIPAGSYLLWGKFSFSSSIAQSVNCQIVITGAGGYVIDTNDVVTPAFQTVFESMSLQGSVTLASSGVIGLTCFAGATPSDVVPNTGSLMALQVGTLNP